MTSRREFWQGRRVFVTGCTGILGSWLTLALVEAGAEVVGLVRDSVPQSNLYWSGTHKRIVQVRGSITDYPQLLRSLQEYEIEAVFHLAAQPLVRVANRLPVNTLEANVRGVWLLLEACRHTQTVKRIITASSDKAYGDQDVLPYTEEAPVEGRYPYDVSKSCADLIARAFAHTYDLPIGITRCGNIYGGGDRNWDRIVPGTIRSVLRGEPPLVRSDGTPLRDYLYVDDIVEGYLLLAEHLDDRTLHGQAFNFGMDDPKSALEMIQAIIALSDYPDLKPIILNQASHEIQKQYLSSEKARRVLGWRSRYSLEAGLRRTLAWYRAYLAEVEGLMIRA
ncbi:MAG TPA: NAD-dependent epimerase/dehydratase family protein [Anaerolineae bacterium]|nr:NAD-dependent epimerase/dehydratase family protein [Anaerolineae bacterium]